MPFNLPNQVITLSPKEWVDIFSSGSDTGSIGLTIKGERRVFCEEIFTTPDGLCFAVKVGDLDLETIQALLSPETFKAPSSLLSVFVRKTEKSKSACVGSFIYNRVGFISGEVVVLSVSDKAQNPTDCPALTFTVVQCTSEDTHESSINTHLG